MQRKVIVCIMYWNIYRLFGHPMNIVPVYLFWDIRWVYLCFPHHSSRSCSWKVFWDCPISRLCIGIFDTWTGNSCFFLIYRLTGRGIVEFTIEKGDGSTFSPEAGGELRKTATIQVCQMLHFQKDEIIVSWNLAFCRYMTSIYILRM